MRNTRCRSITKIDDFCQHVDDDVNAAVYGVLQSQHRIKVDFSDVIKKLQNVQADVSVIAKKSYRFLGTTDKAG